MTPAAQTSRRVCLTAAGYTLGTATPEGPKLFHGRAPVRVAEPQIAAVPPRDADVIYIPRADALLAALQDVRGTLPSLGILGRAVGMDASHATSNATEALRTLQRRGLIRWWRGADHGQPGQHAVTLVATGRTLRTAGCGKEVVP